MIKVDVGSLRMTLVAMDNLLLTERKAAKRALGHAGRALLSATKKNMSMTDHTLRDLEKMGNPYARKHGTIQIHSTSKMITNPTSRVHKQDKTLVKSLIGATKNTPQGYMYELTATAPHAKRVIQGTDVMLPRDVLWDTANAPVIRKKMMLAVIKVLGKMLRAKAAVRFETLGE